MRTLADGAPDRRRKPRGNGVADAIMDEVFSVLRACTEPYKKRIVELEYKIERLEADLEASRRNRTSG